MRLIPRPRRHRALWLIAAVLGVSAWGSWLVSTGRAADYSNSSANMPAAGTPQASASNDDAMSRGILPDMTPDGPVRDPSTHGAADPDTSAPDRADVASSSSQWQAGEPEPAAITSPAAGLAGMTDPAWFARAVADSLLSYDAGDDFNARVDAVMAVAALPPLGSPAQLAADLSRFTPSPVVTLGEASVTFTPDSVEASAWASAQFDRLKLPAGTFAIDVSGSQIITMPGTSPVSVSITIGVTGACPPALIQCEIDRIFPRTVAQELDR